MTVSNHPINTYNILYVTHKLQYPVILSTKLSLSPWEPPSANLRYNIQCNFSPIGSCRLPSIAMQFICLAMGYSPSGAVSSLNVNVIMFVLLKLCRVC